MCSKIRSKPHEPLKKKAINWISAKLEVYAFQRHSKKWKDTPQNGRQSLQITYLTTYK